MNDHVVIGEDGRPMKFGPHFPPFRWYQKVSSQTIVLIDNVDIAAEMLPKLLNELWSRALKERDVAIGFDVEWKPNRGGAVNPIAVIQLASVTQVFIIHLSKWRESSPSNDLGPGMRALKLILGLGHIKKVGVTLLDDAMKVWHDLGASMRGCVELNTMMHNVDLVGFNSIPQHPVGLAKMADMYLKLRLEKNQRIRASNWEDNMSDAQLEYAANDAVCSLFIFLEFKIRLTAAQYEDATGEFDVVEGSEVTFAN